MYKKAKELEYFIILPGHLRPLRWVEFWNFCDETSHLQLTGDEPSHHVQKSSITQFLPKTLAKKYAFTVLDFLFGHDVMVCTLTFTNAMFFLLEL